MKNVGDFDGIAISLVIKVPVNYHMDYFNSEGNMINPWGGVKAMLTHSLSSILNVQSAHAPMFESKSPTRNESSVFSLLRDGA